MKITHIGRMNIVQKILKENKQIHDMKTLDKNPRIAALEIQARILADKVKKEGIQ